MTMADNHFFQLSLDVDINQCSHRVGGLGETDVLLDRTDEEYLDVELRTPWFLKDVLHQAVSTIASQDEMTACPKLLSTTAYLDAVHLDSDRQQQTTQEPKRDELEEGDKQADQAAVWQQFQQRLSPEKHAHPSLEVVKTLLANLQEVSFRSLPGDIISIGDEDSESDQSTEYANGPMF
jgi:hypothetical protein